MSGQQTIVRDHDIVSDEAIVTNVRSAHQKILVANFRGAAVGAAAMNRAVLADNIVVADFDLRLSFQRKRNILRWHSDDRAVSDEISTGDCTMVCLPIVTSGPTIENGPICTSAPIFAFGSTIAVE